MTCLGLSRDKPQGRGVGDHNATEIFDKILASRAVETGLIQDIEDNVLFIDHFGKDKLSDMTTNIITKHLIVYTQNQCNLHNIGLTKNIASGYYWTKQNEWDIEYTDMLVIDGKPILLVPKGIVSYNVEYSADKYYNQFILDFLQNDHLRLNSLLVKKRKNNKTYVTKKDLKQAYPKSKNFLRDFTERHPEILEQFKKEIKGRSLTNRELTEFNLKDLCKLLATNLVNIPSGNDAASNYHNCILGILELLFYPFLIYPVKEKEIHNARKRIDITFDNAATNGIFFRFSHNMRIPWQFIFIECKNYSNDPVNPELDQLSGRFSVNRGQIGFLLCRTFKNRDLFIERCRDTYTDGRGLIIPLVDQDIINLLDNYDEYNSAFLDKYISNIVREVTLN